MAALFALILVLVGPFGVEKTDHFITVLVILIAVINDSVFWMNIVQVTMQRYDDAALPDRPTLQRVWVAVLGQV